MPSRRDLIRMSREEIQTYLKNHSRIILVTKGPTASPTPCR